MGALVLPVAVPGGFASHQHPSNTRAGCHNFWPPKVFGDAQNQFEINSKITEKNRKRRQKVKKITFEKKTENPANEPQRKKKTKRK